MWKIDQINNNKKIRDGINEKIGKVLNGTLTDKDGNLMTEADLVEAARSELRVSGEFIQELINASRASMENSASQKPTKGFFDYVGMAWDKITPW